ncbi:MAG: prephenate dehydrogenase/arogenate dehydrogenase family protein, partial [Candidatus Omnitrophica bacterium]|nr:prephenate dehydrogenase/arogenate dehydrogenase family protein [Candidatus Omnitrophota bacterium]
NYLRFSGSGLKDFARLAGSGAEVWVDIFLSNSENLISNLKDLEKTVKDLKLSLKQKDAFSLFKFIKRANSKYSLLK